MGDRRTLDAHAVGLMLVFCLTLGMQQVALKATGDDISPVLQIALRSGLGAALIACYMLARGQRMSLGDGSWKPGLIVGGLFSLEYVLLGEALRFTTASHAVVFLYTAPIFTALLLHFLVRDERMAAMQWLGISLAFVGIGVAFLLPAGGDVEAAGQASLWGDLLALLAGVAWGATTVLVRTTRLSSLAPEQTLMYQLVAAFVVLLASAAVLGQLAIDPTPLALTSLAFQSVIVSFAGFLVWFWLIRHYQASRIGVLSFLTPLFGVGFGTWLLDEPIEPGFMIGAVMVVAGITLVSGEGWIRQWLASRRRQAAMFGK
ncbi:DMT family transporter [Halomonas sp. DP8Y7-3]|uniref:DMT family transporter n=1 Tax=Halomonas sp. DP8Y7-3 TaxID=2859079 RepID=UPI001C96CF30|nr:DMT family transporter [Halomonas sp. DP8Y7-3]MBY5930909.1 DMT family transporter [Halomonas sp. DP8Y7-3]